MNRVAIKRRNFILWGNLFDMIAAVDGSIQYNDLQYTQRDSGVRNQIKTLPQWQAVPVQVKDKCSLSSREMEIDDSRWTEVKRREGPSLRTTSVLNISNKLQQHSIRSTFGACTPNLHERHHCTSANKNGLHSYLCRYSYVQG